MVYSGLKRDISRPALKRVPKIFSFLVTAQLVYRRATGWTPKVQFPTVSTDFSLHHGVQTTSGAHPPANTMGTGGPIHRSKAAGA
jgi:hypothetical protein